MPLYLKRVEYTAGEGVNTGGNQIGAGANHLVEARNSQAYKNVIGTGYISRYIYVRSFQTKEKRRQEEKNGKSKKSATG